VLTVKALLRREPVLQPIAHRTCITGEGGTGNNMNRKYHPVRYFGITRTGETILQLSGLWLNAVAGCCAGTHCACLERLGRLGRFFFRLTPKPDFPGNAPMDGFFPIRPLPRAALTCFSADPESPRACGSRRNRRIKQLPKQPITPAIKNQRILAHARTQRASETNAHQQR
jgi:hypothetical protein